MHDLQKTIEQVFDYLKGIWIKKRYIIISSWLICPVGFIYVATLPDTFQSTARVYVDTKSLLQPLLRGLAIQTNPEQEIATMARMLKSTENMETIARNTDLDITTNNEAQFDNLVSSLQRGINLRAAGRGDNTYTISFSHQKPEIARKVVDETLKLFMEGSLGNSRRDSDSAQRFIDEQIDEYEQRLIQAEQRLADFKRKYSNILPASGGFYSNLSGLEQNLESTRLSMKEVQKKIELIENQLDNDKPTTDSFSVRQSDSEIALTTRYDVRIQELESKLDQLKLRFTELHPDVIETKNLLDNLLSLRQQEIQSYLEANSGSGETLVGGPIGTEMGIQLNTFRTELASLQVREADFQRKIDEIKDKIDLVPQIEAESTALNRDYGITKQKYEELLSRREAAELSEKADLSSEDVQFRVIDPPKLPRVPQSNRLMLYTMVLVAGFASGLGIAFLVSQLTPVLVRGNQLISITDIPIFGHVSHLDLAKINKTNRTRLAVFIVSSGLIIGCYSLLATAELMHVNLFTKIMS